MIDENKLIEEIEKIDLHGRMREYAGLCAAVDIIKNQPKVGEWIPCSERLPEESGTYIVNAIENSIVHVTFSKWLPRMKKWNLTGCRWVDMKTQDNNRRNTLYVEINGKSYTISELSDITGINRSTLNNRYYRGDRGKQLIREERKYGTLD